MINVLIVDDEPLICKGLNNLLAESGMNIDQIFIAFSGYEAMDYIRMEDIHLLITDIQMGAMSGIELMHQAKMMKPWIQTIIISAHETFQYAQMAIRLGAKDYLIKPLNSEQFLDSVRDVVMKLDQSAPVIDDIISGLRHDFQLKEHQPRHNELLNRLVHHTEETLSSSHAAAGLQQLQLTGPYYSMIKIQMNLMGEDKVRHFTEKDIPLIRYALLNISEEMMQEEWNAQNFYSGDQEISLILQWSEELVDNSTINKVNHLEMIGRSLHMNIYKYLNIRCVVGMSQILKGYEFLSTLDNQATRALQWNQKHYDHYVFYYGDFNWSMYSQEPSEEEVRTQNNMIIEHVKRDVEENYGQKGLTIHEVAKRHHVSPNYLSYLFKKITGYNLWEYVIKLRMEESKELLLSTDMRRYEIAERVGYESPEHFSKIFKKYYGYSPSELKK